jgi:hypothetical protein
MKIANRFRRILLLVAVVVASEGCASTVYKSRGVRDTPLQKVWITSEPEGATVRLDGVVVGVTPMQVSVRRKGPLQTLSLSKEGYADAHQPLKRGLSPAAYGNVAFAAFALNPMNGPNGLSDTRWSRREQVAYAFIFPAVGLGVDLLSGAAYAVRSPVHITLKPAVPPPSR